MFAFCLDLKQKQKFNTQILFLDVKKTSFVRSIYKNKGIKKFNNTKSNNF